MVVVAVVVAVLVLVAVVLVVVLVVADLKFFAVECNTPSPPPPPPRLVGPYAQFIRVHGSQEYTGCRTTRAMIMVRDNTRVGHRLGLR